VDLTRLPQPLAALLVALSLLPAPLAALAAGPLYFEFALVEDFEQGGESLFFEGQKGERVFMVTAGRYQLDAGRSVISASSTIPVIDPAARLSTTLELISPRESDSPPLYGLILERAREEEGVSLVGCGISGGRAVVFELDGPGERPEMVAEGAEVKEPYGPVRLTLAYFPDRLLCYVDGELAVRAPLPPYRPKGVGMFVAGGGVLAADDLVLQKPVFRAMDLTTDFSDLREEAKRWFVGRAGNAVYALREEGYVINTMSARRPAVAMPEGGAADLSLSASLRYLDGDPSVGFGLFIRARSDRQGRMSYLRVLINDLSGVVVQLHTPKGEKNLWGWEISKLYREGEENRLRVEVFGRNLYVSLNGQRVAALSLPEDLTIQPGRFGIIVFPGTKVAVSHFAVQVHDPAILPSGGGEP